MPAPAPGGAAASGTAAPAAGAFACARCGKTLRMPPGSGGKKGKCPACGETFQIPAETAGRSAGPAPRPAASPSPVAGLTPIGNAGLTPLSESYEVLDDGGLAAADLSSGLTPLSGRLGALNMAPNPFADPLADPLVSAAAAGGLSVNPYQSPASLGTAKKRVRSRGDFGYVDVLPAPAAANGEPPGFVYLTPQNLQAWLPEIWWGMVLGPAYVDLIGGDVVASAPAHEVTRIGPVTYWLQLTEQLEQPPTGADPLGRQRREVAAHLGERLFWKAGRTAFAAPRFAATEAGRR